MTPLLKSLSKIPLAFGGAAISGEGGGYGFGPISEGESMDLLHLAYESGIRIFDTAPIYGFHLSEFRMGLAFKNLREKVFIVSKSGVTWGDNKRVDMTNDPKVTKAMLEHSLKNLGSDYIDLYMIHWPDSKVDIRRPLEILSKAKLEGKIKHIGLCNTSLDDLNKAVEIDRIEVVQSEFNFFNHQFIKSLFPYLKANNISFMSWGTLDKGILTGRVDQKRVFDKSDCRSFAPWWKEADRNPKYQAMEKLKPFLESYNHTGLELALGFNLSFLELSVAICGARNQEQLLSILKALKNLPHQDIINEALKIAQFTQN